MPGDNELAAADTGDVRIRLRIRCVGIDQELAAQGGAGGIITLAVDIPIIGSFILVLRMPGDDKAAVIELRHRCFLLLARSVGVDPELIAIGGTAGVITLAVDVIDIIGIAVLILSLPGDDETAAGKAGYIRPILLFSGVAIDQDLRTLRLAASIIALAEDVMAASAA